MRRINMNAEIAYLKGIIDYCNRGKMTREEMYRNWYGDLTYKSFLEKGSLDKYLSEAILAN